MVKNVLITLALLAAFGLGYFVKAATTPAIEKINVPKPPPTNETSQQIKGIGGIFFKCKDPKAIKTWYKNNLGLNTDQYGARFEWLDVTKPEEKNSLQWSPFPENESYFNPSTKEFMINYCVSNLTTLVEQLKKNGITPLDTIETYDYGKFIHIMDPEGNKIELWEPKYDFTPAPESK